MILLIVSILLFALNNVLWKKNLQEIPVSALMAYRSFFTSTIVIIFVFLEFELTYLMKLPFYKISLGSLFGVAGLFCMLVYLKKAPLQWLGIYNLLGIIFTTIYLYFFENITMNYSVMGVILIIFGFIFYLYQNKESKESIHYKQHISLFLMTAFFGVSSILHWKNLGTDVPAILIICNQEIFVFLSATIGSFILYKPTDLELIVKNYFFKVFFMAVIIFFALLSSMLGLKLTNPILSSLLFLATPLLTILFGSLFFKEKITNSNVLAILIIATGAFLLHYFSS
jgi:EamA domain-containing membrane protein RarD